MGMIKILLENPFNNNNSILNNILYTKDVTIKNHIVEFQIDGFNLKEILSFEISTYGEFCFEFKIFGAGIILTIINKEYICRNN